MKPTTHAYLMTQAPANDAGVAQTGGQIKRYTPASAFTKGDVCYISAAGTVSKSATSANYAGYQGVVVGGDLTQGALDADNGTTVCTATTGYVLVQIDGIAYVRLEGTVTVGTNFSVISTARYCIGNWCNWRLHSYSYPSPVINSYGVHSALSFNPCSEAHCGPQVSYGYSFTGEVENYY